MPYRVSNDAIKDFVKLIEDMEYTGEYFEEGDTVLSKEAVKEFTDYINKLKDVRVKENFDNNKNQLYNHYLVHVLNPEGTKTEQMIQRESESSYTNIYYNYMDLEDYEQEAEIISNIRRPTYYMSDYGSVIKTKTVLKNWNKFLKTESGSILFDIDRTYHPDVLIMQWSTLLPGYIDVCFIDRKTFNKGKRAANSLFPVDINGAQNFIDILTSKPVDLNGKSGRELKDYPSWQ